MMDGKQPSLLQSMADRPPTHAQVEQLISGHRAVLSVGKLRDQQVRRPGRTSGPNVGPNIPVAAHGLIVALSLRPRARACNESATLVHKA
jgi:hypothetical protein